MPRKAFIADLHEAAETLDIDHLSSLKAGDEDGTITFKFHIEPRPIPSGPGVTVSAIVPGTNGSYLEPQFTGLFHANICCRCL